MLTRKQVEANEAYLQRVFRHTAVGIAIFRVPDFIIEVANPEMCTIWGRSEDDVLGKPMLEALPELVGQGFDTLLADSMQTGQPRIKKELPVTFKRNGELGTNYFDLVFEPLLNVDGWTNRVMVTASVVTERWQARQQIEQLLFRERELNELKSNFVTLASHEFRTPMTTILSSAGLIRSYNDADDGVKHERHVQRIESAVDSLTNLLDDFLSLSQMEKQTLYSHPQPTDIRLFCDELVDNMLGIVKPGQRVIYRHLTGGSSILIDAKLLSTILINLLVNASKYSADGKEIELTTTVQEGELLLTVRDEGIGIPDEDKDKLFVNFFRASNVTQVPGTGLGLYVVKRYVELLGGRITFTSQLDSDTIFTVQLPLSPLPLTT